MNTSYKSEIFWNKLSKNYDKKAKDKAYHLIIDKSKKYFKKSDILLDFACATGLYTVAFAKNVSAIEAFDISSKMIEISKKKAKSLLLIILIFYKLLFLIKGTKPLVLMLFLLLIFYYTLKITKV